MTPELVSVWFVHTQSSLCGRGCSGYLLEPCGNGLGITGRKNRVCPLFVPPGAEVTSPLRAVGLLPLRQPLGFVLGG